MTREQELAAIEAFVAEGRHTVVPMGYGTEGFAELNKRLRRGRLNANKRHRKAMCSTQERRRKDVKVEL